MKENEQIIIRPLITEKATLLKKDDIYVFVVRADATKIDIRRAVEMMFSVKVLDVNTVKLKGKPRSMGKHAGRTSSWKKAYVKLKAGQRIELIEGML
ncbi:MAG: 50S ribosomal protein L23 [Candidatus Saganbacteria bacterium]|nr:50S ribosomal protein L23 [Candidatus Saganbacteria bacterium]